MKFVLIAAVLLCAGVNPVARAAVLVSAFRVEETRAIELADDKVSRSQPGLKILLFLQGPEAESCVKYGDLKLDTAVDDLGSSLVLSKDPWNDASKFKEYSNAFFRKSKFHPSDQQASPEVELNLAPCKRAATKISRLRGSLTLCDIGTIQSVELANLNQPGMKKLPIPAGAHIEVTADVPAGESVRSIAIQISGDESVLESIDVVDAAGNKISSGISSWTVNGGPAHKSLDLHKPLDSSMKLVAKVALNRKRVTVPFDLKDLPLP